MKKLRCAVIGCGRIGCSFDDFKFGKIPRTHAGCYIKHSKTELVALCDIDKKKLEKYGKKFNVKNLYQNFSTMFKHEDLDCISICTLANSHLEIIREAQKYNIKNIFIEKPFSNSLPNAQKIIDICKKNNILLLVDHQRRFSPFYIQLKKLIQEKLGNIQTITIHYGSGIANTGSHIFDLLLYLFGEISSVQCICGKNISQNINDPNLDCVLEFKKKFSANLISLNLKYYGVLEMNVYGTLGSMKIDLISDKLTYFIPTSVNKLAYSSLIKAKKMINSSPHSSLYYGIDNMINSIEKKKKPLSTEIEGYQSLELIIASLLSSRKHGRKISLPVKSNYILHSK